MTDREACLNKVELAVVDGRNEGRARGGAARRWGMLPRDWICGTAASRCHQHAFAIECVLYRMCSL